MRLRRLAAAALLAIALPASAAQWTLTDVLPVAGESRDRISPSRPAANVNRLGFFSDLTHDAATGTWFALSDRGPGGGVVGYATRVQQMIIPVHPITGTLLGRPVVLRTILFTDPQGQPFNGLNPALLNGDPQLGQNMHPCRSIFFIGKKRLLRWCRKGALAHLEYEKMTASCEIAISIL